MQAGWLQRHPWRARFTLALLGLVIGIAAAEGILRARGDFKLGLERAIRLRELNPNSLRYVYFSHKDAPEQSNREYRLKVDANGFIMPGAPHADPDVTVVFLGGSTTECLHMADDHRFPCQAGTLLEKKTGLKVNSYNGGMAGNNSLHSLDALLNKVIPLQPKIVVLMHNINDLAILLHEGSYWNANPTRGPMEVIGGYHVLRAVKDLLIPNLYEKLRALRHTTPDEFARARGKKVHVDEAWMAGQFEANLQIFVDICRARGIIPVLMTQESRFKEHPDPEVLARTSLLATSNGVSYEQFRGLHERFNESIRTVGGRNKVPVIDLARDVPQEREYIYGTVHLNQHGSDVVSAEIADRLAALLEPAKGGGGEATAPTESVAR